MNEKHTEEILEKPILKQENPILNKSRNCWDACNKARSINK